MKELLIKEKAKAYDGLIERLKDLKFAYRFSPLSDTIEEKFPELKESEDERIREALIDGFTVMKESKNCGKTFSNHNIPVADILAWLEKQGEQKPEWTPMDEQRVENLLAIIEGHGYPGEVAWLNSLKDRVQSKQDEQKPVIVPKFKEGDIIKHKDTNEIFEVSNIEIYDADEIYYRLTNGGCICENADNFERVEQNPAWSEDDETILKAVILNLEESKKYCAIPSAKYVSKCINWLKSIKPQNRWKPSDRELGAILVAIGDERQKGSDAAKELQKIYQHLKKLMKE